MFCWVAVQSDRDGSLSYTLLYTYRCMVKYYTTKGYWVASVDPSVNVEKQTQWDGNATWPQRNYFGEPRQLGEEATELTGNRASISLIKVDKDQLEPVPKKLVDRTFHELRYYIGSPTPDRLLALACNPFTASVAVTVLEYLSEDLQEAALAADDQDTSDYAFDFTQLAKQALEEQIRETCSALLPAMQGQATAEEAPAAPATVDLEVQRMLQRRRPRSQQRTPTVAVDPVKKEIDEFFSFDFNPRQAMANQKPPVPNDVLNSIGTDKDYWMANWETIAKYFDIMQWWERGGKERFPLIYIVACCILALPDSNGHQERTFSAATWMDGKLKNRQTDLTFQMKVILYKNKDFLEAHRKVIQEAARLVAEERVKDLLDLSAMMRSASIADEAPKDGEDATMTEAETASITVSVASEEEWDEGDLDAELDSFIQTVAQATTGSEEGP